LPSHVLQHPKGLLAHLPNTLSSTTASVRPPEPLRYWNGVLLGSELADLVLELIYSAFELKQVRRELVLPFYFGQHFAQHLVFF
jgi:hypothetical protein